MSIMHYDEKVKEWMIGPIPLWFALTAFTTALIALLGARMAGFV